jgi:hypothetical protein
MTHCHVSANKKREDSLESMPLDTHLVLRTFVLLLGQSAWNKSVRLEFLEVIYETSSR